AYDNIGLQLPGVVRPVYTSRWKWSIAFGTQEWPHAAESPLLEARYWFNSGFAPNEPPSLEWMWLPFGGWTERAMLQYAGTVDTLGVGVDRCVYDQARMFAVEEETEEETEEELTVSQYEELRKLIIAKANEARAFTQKVHDAVVARLGAAENKIAALEARRPAPKPAPKPRVQYVIVKSGDTADKWFNSEDALIRFNPNFRTLAYRADGSIMRRFTNRRWNDIYPPEQLRIK
ncbi:hypothetical protein LCGC14_2698350, partial [marine sediment metagenome]